MHDKDDFLDGGYYRISLFNGENIDTAKRHAHRAKSQAEMGAGDLDGDRLPGKRLSRYRDQDFMVKDVYRETETDFFCLPIGMGGEACRRDELLGALSVRQSQHGLWTDGQ